MVIDKIATSLTQQEIESGVEDYMAIGKLLDAGLGAQVQLDLASLAKATGRTFSDQEKAEIAQAQTKAYRRTFLLSGMTHPNFDRTLRELTQSGHAEVSGLAHRLNIS